MRAWLALALLAACEMDVPPKRSASERAAPSPVIAEHAREDRQVHVLDVIVREYGSKDPIEDADIELVQWPDCHAVDGPCPDAARHVGRSDEQGRAHFELPLPMWNIARISAPSYASTCPGLYDDTARHRLVIDHRLDDGETYTCMLVPMPLLRVDRTGAIKRARAEVGSWLATHPGARMTATRDGISWNVVFEPRRANTLLVIVDALDGHIEITELDQGFERVWITSPE